MSPKVMRMPVRVRSVRNGSPRSSCLRLVWPDVSDFAGGLVFQVSLDDFLRDLPGESRPVECFALHIVHGAARASYAKAFVLLTTCV
ncbi:unnamed protein product, partial [Brenthis ino]